MKILSFLSFALLIQLAALGQIKKVDFAGYNFIKYKSALMSGGPHGTYVYQPLYENQGDQYKSGEIILDLKMKYFKIIWAEYGDISNCKFYKVDNLAPENNDKFMGVISKTIYSGGKWENNGIDAILIVSHMKDDKCIITIKSGKVIDEEKQIDCWKEAYMFATSGHCFEIIESIDVKNKRIKLEQQKQATIQLEKQKELAKQKEIEIQNLKQKEMEEEEKRIKAKNEYKDRVINSNFYFKPDDISNKDFIKITFPHEALSIICDFFEEYSLELPELKKYNSFDINLFFNKSCKLVKIEVKPLNNADVISTIELPERYFTQICDLKLINTFAKINLNDTDYAVNSYYPLWLKRNVNSSKLYASIKKNNNGDYVIIENYNLPDKVLLDIIRNDEGISVLKKGKYRLTIDAVYDEYIVSHLYNNSTKDEIKHNKTTNRITEINPINNEQKNINDDIYYSRPKH